MYYVKDDNTILKEFKLDNVQQSGIINFISKFQQDTL